MRHGKHNKKLARPTDQRLAMLRSMVCALLEHNQIQTTRVRAKQVQRLADRVITLAKVNDLAAKRRVVAMLQDKALAKKLWGQSEKFAARKGGHTRLINIGTRRGDAAPLVLLELVDIASASR